MSNPRTTEEEEAVQSQERPQLSAEVSPRAIRVRQFHPRLIFVLAVAVTACLVGAIVLPRFLEGVSGGFAGLVNATPFLKSLLGEKEAAQVPYATYPYVYVAMGMLGLLLGAGASNLLYSLGSKAIASWEKLGIGDKVDLFLGIFVGIILSFPFYALFQAFGQVASPLLTITLSFGFAALAVYVLKSIQEVLPWHAKATVTTRRTGIKILDTNVFIDGRLYDIAKTGFIDGELYVPQFVLQELQTIADSSDSMRRQRGRRGLEVLRHLQAEFKVNVGSHDRHASDEKEPVDARLVRLAKAIGADLISNDYNLNKVARIQDVRVLNINDLALSLRPMVLPGELMEVALIREGSQYGQAVGYLDDGTMVVVEGGRPMIGESVEVTVTQVIQTERGKMIFASVEGMDGMSPGPRRRGR